MQTPGCKKKGTTPRGGSGLTTGDGDFRPDVSAIRPSGTRNYPPGAVLGMQDRSPETQKRVREKGGNPMGGNGLTTGGGDFRPDVSVSRPPGTRDPVKGVVGMPGRSPETQKNKLENVLQGTAYKSLMTLVNSQDRLGAVRKVNGATSWCRRGAQSPEK